MNDNNDDEAVDLRAAIARIVAGRWWVLASVIVFAVGFAIAEIETKHVRILFYFVYVSHWFCSEHYYFPYSSRNS